MADFFAFSKGVLEPLGDAFFHSSGIPSPMTQSPPPKSPIQLKEQLRELFQTLPGHSSEAKEAVLMEILVKGY
jgi:hypothetical protein